MLWPIRVSFFLLFFDLGLIRGGSRYDTIRFGVTRASYRFERITEPQAGTAAAAARAASPKPESSEPGRWTEEVIELPRRGGSHGSSDHRRHELQRTRRRRPVAAVTADRGAAARRPPSSSPRGRRVSFEVEGNGNGDGSGSGHASGTYDEESGSDQGDVFSEDSLGSCDDAEEAAWASPAPRAAQYHRPSRYDSPLPQPALVPPPSGRRQKPLRYDDDHGARARPRSGRARHDGYHERRHDQHDDHRDHHRDRDREHRPSSSSRPRSRREARPPSPRESGGGGSPSSRRRTAERPPRPPERPRSSRRNIRGGASTVLPSRAPTDRPAAGFRRASTVVQQHQQSTPVKHRFQPPKKSVAYDMLCGNFDVISDHSSRIFFFSPMPPHTCRPTAYNMLCVAHAYSMPICACILMLRSIHVSRWHSEEDPPRPSSAGVAVGDANGRLDDTEWKVVRVGKSRTDTVQLSESAQPDLRDVLSEVVDALNQSTSAQRDDGGARDALAPQSPKRRGLHRGDVPGWVCERLVTVKGSVKLLQRSTHDQIRALIGLHSTVGLQCPQTLSEAFAITGQMLPAPGPFVEDEVANLSWHGQPIAIDPSLEGLRLVQHQLQIIAEVLATLSADVATEMSVQQTAAVRLSRVAAAKDMDDQHQDMADEMAVQLRAATEDMERQLQHAYIELEVARNEAENQKDIREREVAAVAARLDRSDADLITKDEKIELLEQEIDRTLSERRDTMLEIAEADMANELRSQLGESTTMLHHVQGRADNLQNEVDAHAVEIVTLRDALDAERHARLVAVKVAETEQMRWRDKYDAVSRTATSLTQMQTTSTAASEDNARLREENGRLCIRVTSLERQCADQQHTAQQLADRSNQLLQVEPEVIALRQSHSALEDLLRQKDRTLAELEQVLLDKKAAVAANNRDLAAQATLLARREADIKECKLAQVGLEATLAKSDQKIVGMERTLLKNRADLAANKLDCAKLTTLLSNQEAELSASRQSESNLEATTGKLAAEIAVLNEAVQASQKIAAEHKAAHLQSSETELQVATEKLTAEIALKESAAAGQRTSDQQVTQLQADLDRSRSSAAVEIAALKHAAAAEQAAHSIAEQNINSLEATTGKLAAEIAVLNEAVQASQKIAAEHKAAHLQSSETELQVATEKLTAEIALKESAAAGQRTSDQQVTQLQADLDRSRSSAAVEIAALKHAAAAEQAAHSIVTEQMVAQLKSDFDESRSSTARAATAADELRAARDRTLQAELAEMGKERAKLRAKISRLEAGDWGGARVAREKREEATSLAKFRSRSRSPARPTKSSNAEPAVPVAPAHPPCMLGTPRLSRLPVPTVSVTHVDGAAAATAAKSNAEPNAATTSAHPDTPRPRRRSSVSPSSVSANNTDGTAAANAEANAATSTVALAPAVLVKADAVAVAQRMADAMIAAAAKATADAKAATHEPGSS